MDISQLRKEFTVFVVDTDFRQAQSLVETIKATGYEDTKYFPTLEAALAVTRQSPPHLMIIEQGSVESTVERFLIEIQAISPEILSILITHAKLKLSSMQLISRGLACDSVARPFVSTLEIVQALDRGSIRLYHQFESEQLREHFEGSNSSSNSNSGDGAEAGMGMGTGTDATGDRPAFAAVPTSPSMAVSDYTGLNEFLARMTGVKELDQCVQLFMESVSRVFSDVPVLYFRYVASHMSLLVSQAVWLPIEKIRGIGVDLKNEDPARLPEYFRDPSRMEPLKTLIQQVFRRERFTAFEHGSDGETLGLFVILENVEVNAESGIVQSLRKIFDLTYKRNLTLKEKHALDTTDPLTGLINRRHFSQRLDEEISRSRRILMPVSLISVDVDGLKRLNDRIGFQQTDAVLKMIAMILKKTARVSDILARTGPDEIALLLPHTAHMGAAVKAERIRRTLESTRFPLLDGLGLGPLTVSCGVSEYPSFCNDAEGLLRTVDEALVQVKQAGGNKVCLAVAPPGFEMDFVPHEVPFSGPPPGSRRGEANR